MLSPPPDEIARRQVYSQTLQRELQGVEVGQYSLKIPACRGVWAEDLKPISNHPWPLHLTPEVYFQIEGETEFLLPYETFTLKPGDAAIMPRGLPHWQRGVDRNRPFQIMTGMFIPTEGIFTFHLCNALSSEHALLGGPLDRFKVRDHLRMCRLVDEIVDVHEDLRKPDHARIRGLFMAYLAWALERGEGESAPLLEEPLLIRECRQMIQTEMARHDLSVRWLAGRLSCTPHHLSQRFQEVTGMRLTRYIQEYRLKQAIELLETTDLKISAIATTCGFHCPSYFHRVFLKLRGITPTAIRSGKV